MELEEIAEGTGCGPDVEDAGTDLLQPSDPAPAWVDAYEF